MVQITVKWGKETLSVAVDVAAPAAALKAELQRLTNVPADRQKIMGVKGGQLKDDADLAAVGVKEGKTLMLIGTADEVAAAPAASTVFAEDNVDGGHDENVIMSNGLKNIGNTCYLNSCVQVLRTVPELRGDLGDGAKNPVAKSYSSLVTELDATKKAVAPMLFFASFITSYPTFGQTADNGAPMQHDAQEAMSSVLQSIGERDPSTPVFRGALTETLTRVGQSEPPTVKQVPFTMLTCHMGGDTSTVEIGLERSMESTFTGADGTEFSRTSLVSELPQYIVVHMVRFAWRDDTKNKAKILKPIGFPTVLDMQRLCTDELKARLAPARAEAATRRDAVMAQRRRKKNKSNHDDDDDAEAPAEVAPAPEGGDPISGYYELSGVVSHKGRDADGGHYVAWCKKKDAWLIFDDDHVGQVTEDDVLRLRGVGEAHIAYMLIYRCRDPDTKRSSLPM
jgi:ubiquitin carboxyl-terminal hydrolase 14